MSLNCLPRCVIKFRKWRKRLEIWEQTRSWTRRASEIVSAPTGNYFYASPPFFFLSLFWNEMRESKCSRGVSGEVVVHLLLPWKGSRYFCRREDVGISEKLFLDFLTEFEYYWWDCTYRINKFSSFLLFNK